MFSMRDWNEHSGSEKHEALNAAAADARARTARNKATRLHEQDTAMVCETPVVKFEALAGPTSEEDVGLLHDALGPPGQSARAGKAAISPPGASSIALSPNEPSKALHMYKSSTVLTSSDSKPHSSELVFQLTPPVSQFHNKGLAQNTAVPTRKRKLFVDACPGRVQGLGLREVSTAPDGKQSKGSLPCSPVPDSKKTRLTKADTTALSKAAPIAKHKPNSKSRVHVQGKGPAVPSWSPCMTVSNPIGNLVLHWQQMVRLWSRCLSRTLGLQTGIRQGM